jgi:hypothetical protein
MVFANKIMEPKGNIVSVHFFTSDILKGIYY